MQVLLVIICYYCTISTSACAGCQSRLARGMWRRENVKKGRRLKATLCIKDDAWDVCMTIFYAARISRPVLHCPVLPSAPNCPLLALTPKTIDTGPLSYKVFHISKELLASPFVHLDEGFMLILPLGELLPQIFSMPLPTLKLETPQWKPCKCARQKC